MAKIPTKAAVRKKAAAPMSEQVKYLLRSERRKLAREQEALEERLNEETKNRLNAKLPDPSATGYLRPTHTDPTEIAFQKIVIPRTCAVLASEGVRATVNVKMNSLRTSAWTDFQNIMATMKRGVESDPLNAAAVLRGMLYHEAGHIKYTVPVNVLVNRYNAAIVGTDRERLTVRDVIVYKKAWNLAEDQRMESLVIDDSPNKVRYFVPMVLEAVLHQSLDAGAYPYVAWRRYMNKNFRRTLRNKYIAAYGYEATRALEKALTAYVRATGPVETFDAVVAFHNALATSGVTINIDNHEGFFKEYGSGFPAERKDEEWPTVDVPDDEADPEDELTDEPVIPVTPVATPVDEDDDLDDDDHNAPTPGDEATWDDEPEDEEDEPEEDEEDDEPLGSLPPLDFDDESWVPPSTLDFSIDGEDDEPEPEPEPQPDPVPAGPRGEQNNADVERDNTGTPDDDYQEVDEDDDDDEEVDDDDEDLEDEIQRMLDEAVEERNADPILVDDVREFNAAVADGISGSLLATEYTGPESNTEVTATAFTLAEQLEEAFHAVTTEAAPTWREQQTRGVINVSRYLTKQHGDREFFRDFDGTEGTKPGYNIAVSIMLDYSGSMLGTEGKLAATAYAMKKACDNLEIPCTVVLWDHEARLLWDGDQQADYVPKFHARGSTDPTIALNDIGNQRYNRENHIVLLMTDGGFHTIDGYLNEFRSEGTYFIGASYQHGKATSNQELAELSRKGFDIVHGILELSDLVGLMETALCESAKLPVS